MFTIDASASVALRWVELAVLGTNLLDSRYRLGEYNYASDFHSLAAPSRVPSRHFTAGAPRSVFVTLTLSTGEGS